MSLVKVCRNHEKSHMECHSVGMVMCVWLCYEALDSQGNILKMTQVNVAYITHGGWSLLPCCYLSDIEEGRHRLGWSKVNGDHTLENIITVISQYGGSAW